jgi:two-component system OmpR family sensor kinase
MVVVVAGLAAVGLLVADFAGMALLRTSLVQRVDEQLSGQVRILSRGTLPELGTNRRGPSFGPSSITRFYTVDGVGTAGPSSTTAQPELGTFDELRAAADQGPFTVDGVDGSWRVEVVVRSDGTYALAAVSLAEVDRTQATLLFIDGALTLLVLAGIGMAAARVVGFGLRPLTRMEVAAAEIAGGDLSRRVDDEDPHTEPGRLATALNTMLIRIESEMAQRSASEQRLRQFLADAAHELRTPLTSINGFAELYRRGGVAPGPELDEAMGAIGSEVARMRLLVNDLLLLARLDEERPLSLSTVDLLEVAADSVRDAHVRVPTRFVMLGPLDDADDTFDPVTVSGDEARLRQVTTNLVANALQHTPDEAEVVVRVGRAASKAAPAGPGHHPAASTGVDLPAGVPVAIIEVVDTGPGLAPADAVRVFERLYRADMSRSRRHGGAGLGLSIVASIVRAHGGRCEVWTAPGSGARFRVLLPAGEREE